MCASFLAWGHRLLAPRLRTQARKGKPISQSSSVNRNANCFCRCCSSSSSPPPQKFLLHQLRLLTKNPKKSPFRVEARKCGHSFPQIPKQVGFRRVRKCPDPVVASRNSDNFAGSETKKKKIVVNRLHHRCRGSSVARWGVAEGKSRTWPAASAVRQSEREVAKLAVVVQCVG